MNRHLRTCSLEGEVAVIKGMQFWLGGQVTELVGIVHSVSKEAPQGGPTGLGGKSLGLLLCWLSLPEVSYQII